MDRDDIPFGATASKAVAPLRRGPALQRASGLIVTLSVIMMRVFATSALAEVAAPILENGAYHVRPGQSIQAVLDLAARDPSNKVVKVHPGIYRLQKPAQALIHFNHAHDGITLEALGDVTLSAANESIADRSAASFPAVANHVVYFGDGISRRTVLRGFKLTGANNCVTDAGGPEALEPRFTKLRQTEGFYGRLFFFTDGGGIKIFGRSYPTIDRVVVHDNFSSPCAGGVSIEHRGFNENSVLLTNCVFRNNRALVTGSAIDLLPGSAAEIVNCLFVGNISNTGTNYTRVKGNIDWPEIPRLAATTFGYQARHGCGALTVFPNSRVLVDRCTFTANFNGADDKGRSVYRNSIFWRNNATGGIRPGARYELDALDGANVSNCFFNGDIPDLRKTIPLKTNNLTAPDPEFAANFNPQNPAYHNAGYRAPKP